MITVYKSQDRKQELRILDYDESLSSGRYRAVINHHQLAVLHLQTVQTKGTPSFSQLSLCPGVPEDEVLDILSQSFTNTIACVMFLIEKMETDIIYRSRSCELIHRQRVSGEICVSCQELLSDLRGNREGEDDIRAQYSDVKEGGTEDELNNEDEDISYDDSEPAQPLEYTKEDEEPQPSETTRKTISKECGYCGQQFRTQGLLTSHKINEHNEYSNASKQPKKKKNFSCSYCSEKFYTEYNLVKHSNRKHGLNLPLPRKAGLAQCPFCGKEMKIDSPRWIPHLKYYHQEERESEEYKDLMARARVIKYICPTCGKDFVQNTKLELHMVKAHDSHINTLPCQVCGKYLRNQNSLDKHIKEIHEESYRKFICVECGKTFKRNSDLQNHTQRHSAGMFTCTDCERSFSNMSDFRSHFYSKHSNKTRERTKKCKHCEKGFYTERDLSRHFLQVHDKAKPFYCEVCQYKCATLSNLNIHRRKSHEKPNLTKEILINMVENDQHPFYKKTDLEMIRLGIA